MKLPNQTRQKKKPEQDAGSSSTGETQQKEQTKKDTTNSTIKIPSWIWWIPAGLVLAMVAAAVIFRRRIRSYLLLRSLRKNPNFTIIYNKLLSVLTSYGIIRQPSETLRQFAARVDINLQTTDFSALTKTYENLIYSKINEEKGLTTAEINFIQQIIAILSKQKSS